MSTPTMSAPTELVGIEWTLIHLRQDGVLVEPPDGPREVVLRFSADGQMSGTDGCNFFGGPVVISESHLSVGPTYTTDMGCPGIAAFTQAVDSLLRGRAEWAVHDDVLTITGAGGDALVYERRRSIYPSDRPGRPAPAVLVEGQCGAADFRMYYQRFDDRATLNMEHREEPGAGWGYWGTTMELGWSGPEPYPMSTANCRIAGDLYLAGLVTNKVARVSFRPTDSAGSVDLPMYSLADIADIRAYGGFVGDPPRGSSVIAYDAHDAELGPPFEPYWWLPGDPI